MTDRPYSRVYHSIVDDPMFERVYRNPSALGTWLQMLLIADATYPVSAPMTSRNPTVRLLIECGLVIEKPGNRYSIRGLEAERERRSAIGRNAAAVRYQRERTATELPRRDETSKDKTSNGANASEPGVFMGMRPKEPGIWNGAGAHDGRHGKGCRVCTPHPDRAQGVGE